MTTSTITPEIASFAAAVRDALGDLPAEDRDDLTEGLEADLAEAYAEDLRRELPDPVEYAAELRTAAGLPEKVSTRRGFADAWRGVRRDLRSVVDGNPALTSVAEFLVAIRPVWWIARAWIAVWLLTAPLLGENGYLDSFVGWFLLIAAVVVSVQWGRGRWTFRGVAPLVVVGNVIAALLLIPVVAMAGQAGGYVEYVDSGYSQDLTGVYLDGTQVTNIFPYDSTGKPLNDVQLYTEDGRRLATSVQGGNGCIDESTCTEYGLWVARAVPRAVGVQRLPAAHDRDAAGLQRSGRAGRRCTAG